jgi:hypothetical protein
MCGRLLQVLAQRGSVMSLDAELVALWVGHDGQLTDFAHDAGAEADQPTHFFRVC